MTVEELLSIPADRRDCPSDLAFDRRLLGETEPAEERDLTVHLNTCTSCQGRWALREKGARAFPELELGLKRIARNLAEQRRSKRRRLAVFAAWATAAAASAAFFAFAPPLREELTRKGAPGLVVYRQRGGGAEIVTGDQPVHPGDRLRFKVSAAVDKEIMIVCVEDGGEVSLLHPPVGRRSVPLVPQPDGALEGSTLLDDHLGEEWLHLVACARAFTLDDLRVVSPEVIVAPKGCEVTVFHLSKRPA